MLDNALLPQQQLQLAATVRTRPMTTHHPIANATAATVALPTLRPPLPPLPTPQPSPPPPPSLLLSLTVCSRQCQPNFKSNGQESRPKARKYQDQHLLAANASIYMQLDGEGGKAPICFSIQCLVSDVQCFSCISVTVDINKFFGRASAKAAPMTSRSNRCTT